MLHPLNALRAFEAAARHLSFVKAADELHVTPAALSHQVKKLEDYLGAQLFQRLTRGLLLTETGQVLRSELTDIFQRLDRAMERVQIKEVEGALTISVAPMFAVKWLFPRLIDFEARHPAIDLRISSSLNVIDFHRDAFDAAIRFGHGQYEHLTSVRLLEEQLTPVISPHLLAKGPDLIEPADLKDYILLHCDSLSFDPTAPKWSDWLAAANVGSIDVSRGPRFDLPDHTIQAAIDGAGVALGWRTLARDDIAAGRLVAPFDLAIPLGASFHLVYPDAYGDRPKVKTFRAWLLESLSEEV